MHNKTNINVKKQQIHIQHFTLSSFQLKTEKMSHPVTNTFYFWLVEIIV